MFEPFYYVFIVVAVLLLLAINNRSVGDGIEKSLRREKVKRRRSEWSAGAGCVNSTWLVGFYGLWHRCFLALEFERRHQQLF